MIIENRIQEEQHSFQVLLLHRFATCLGKNANPVHMSFVDLEIAWCGLTFAVRGGGGVCAPTLRSDLFMSTVTVVLVFLLLTGNHLRWLLNSISIAVCGFQGQAFKTLSVLDWCPVYVQMMLLSWHQMK